MIVGTRMPRRGSRLTYNPLEPGGVSDYPVKVGSMLLTLVDPNKGFERTRGGVVAGLDRLGGNRVAVALADRERAVRVAVRDDHEELLTAPAADEVFGARHRREAAGDFGKDVVATRVPVRVVDAFEVIDVDQRDRQRVAV